MQNGNGNGSAGDQRTPERRASDAELVLAARAGDKRAFVELVARHQAMVCGIALGVLGDFAASEDAGQEAFLAAWRKLSELREPKRLRAWLAQIAHHAALALLRRRKGHDSLDEAPVLADESPAPDEVAAREEEAALVRESLANLPETYRLPLILFYREGQSVRAVAESLEISEDAVKQRLARGRELLRERMADLVETVLTRTRPSPVFTMAVAVAIGALAAPAVMAGSVFAAASAGAGTASASTTASAPFVTAMSTSKTVLIAASLTALLCIPVGYQVAAPRRPVTGAGANAPVKGAGPALAAAAAPTYENSMLFVEWHKLHDTYGRGSNAMPVLYKAIGDLKDPFRRRAFRSALIAEWVQVDAAGGLRFFLGKGPDDSQRRQFLEEWLAVDARAAVDALLASGPGWENAARECLPELARRAPQRLADVVARLPEPENFWDTDARDAFAIAAAGDLTSARRAAEALTGPNRQRALGGVAQAWAKSDLDGAIAWAKALPAGTDRDEVIRAALVGKAAVDPAAALDQVGLVPPGGRYAWYATTTGARVLKEAAKADFDATVAWMAAHPGRLGQDDLQGLVGAVEERLNADATGFLSRRAEDGSLAAIAPVINNAILNAAAGQRSEIWEWLKQQPENGETRSLKQHVLSSAGNQDPALALRLVADMPRTAEGDKQVEFVAQCLFNGGYMLHRFDSLYEQAPERLRQPLVDAAFQLLRMDNLADPQKWIARLGQLPAALQVRGTESLARAWAGQTPEEAVAWASSLMPGDARNGAMAGIAGAWAAKDARGAAEWVATLASGAERDRGAGSLVTAVADKFPREAWDWAMSIGDPGERSRAAAQAAKAMAARDPATARQWIETGPFTAQTRAELQAALQKGNFTAPR